MSSDEDNRDMEDELPEDEDELEEEDELEDEEEEEEEEDDGRGKKKKRRRRDGAAYFLEREAYVDDSEEDEDVEEEFRAERAMAEKQQRMITEQYNKRRSQSFLARPEEEIEKHFKDRYKDYTVGEEDFEDMGTERSQIHQQSLYPSVRDPKLWMVKCKPGREKSIVTTLMQKFIEKQNDEEDKLLIKSVVSPEHLKGYIYIEAEKETHVSNAIKGMSSLQYWSLKLVPIKEMVDVMTVSKKSVSLQKGDWVRIKRGVYRGDVAQIYDVDEAKGRVTVKIIPRLDFNKDDSKEHLTPDGQKEKRKKTVRPPQRFFNPDEVKLTGGRLMDQRRDVYGGYFYVYDGNKYKDGYLLKVMNIKSLDTNNVIPTIDELQRFQERPANADKSEDAEENPSSLGSLVGNFKPKQRSTFVKGDTVRVIEGDLKNLTGTVESVEDDTVTIKPAHEELHDLLSFPASQIQKSFKVGDHVKVISGRYEGETGLIISLDTNAVVIFSNLTSKEIKVLTQDIQECSDTASGKIELGNYELHDLVQINPQVVGVIVKIERDSFKVLDNNGNVQTIRLQEIGNKRTSKDAVSFDRFQNQIGVGDVVKVANGPFQGRQGTVRHLYKYYAFLHSKDMLENSGIFVVRTGNCEVLGGQKRNGPQVPQSPRHMGSTGFGMGLQSPARNQAASPMGFQSRGAPPANRRRRNDELLNKTVVIKSGQWKGYVGIVKDATDTHARVELHTNCKTITVDRNIVQVKDEANRTYTEAPKTPVWSQDSRSHDFAPSTPMRTPSRTPLHGTVWDPSMTPRFDEPSWPHEYSSVSTPSMNAYPFSPAPYDSHSQPRRGNERGPSTPGVYTPGSTYDHAHGLIPTPSGPGGHTPRDHLPTPQENPYDRPVTPGGPQTPHIPHTPQAVPHTPGTPADAVPNYPSYPEYEDTAKHPAEEADWVSTDIEVTVKNNTALKGVIKEVTPQGCRVVLDSNETVNYKPEELAPVIPHKNKSYVKIIRGEFKGNTGVLMGIDGGDGIVRMDSHDIKILDLNLLAVCREH